MFRPHPKALATFVLLFCCMQAGASIDDSHVVLDSLAGKAQIQRAGQQKWQPAKAGIKLFNNDVLRVLDNSRARLVWTDGSIMYVHSNSQVLVNLYKDTISNLVTRHATVFVGAVFFVIKEVLPKSLSEKYDTKVYTPTAVVAIRGTSFEVRVDEQRGGTDVVVLNGTVLVGNIIRKESIFLAAGYKTNVKMNSDPIKPQAVEEKEIVVLKSWVPEELIQLEMKQQLVQGKKDHYTITGKLEDKVVVMPVALALDYEGDWDIGGVLTDALALELGASLSSMTVTKAEKPEKDLVAEGRKQKARFVLTGEVRDLRVYQHAGMTVTADEYTVSSFAVVKIFLQLVNVEKASLVFSREVGGMVSGKNLPENTMEKIAELKFDMKEKRFSQTILPQAIGQALEETASSVSRYLNQ